MFINQISVFLENRPGTLRQLTELLGLADIDIRELSVADTQSFGIIRMLFAAPQQYKVYELLKHAGYMVKRNHVICAEIDDKPSGLCHLLTILENENLSVEYMYSCRREPDGHALVVLRLSDLRRGEEALAAYGVRMLSQEEFDRL